MYTGREYHPPILIDMKYRAGYAMGACENGSGNVGGNSPGGWGADNTLVGGCGNGISNQAQGGSSNTTACADGSNNAFTGVGGTKKNFTSFCTSGTNVTTTLNDIACDSGSGAIYSDMGYGCKNGSSVSTGCFTGSGL